jgi:hypothetical protein
MAWLATLPPGRAREQGIEDTYRAWLGWHPQQALEWLRAQPPQPWHEPLVPLYAVARSTVDPEDALAWAQRARDERQRHDAMITILRTWRRRDAAAADAWIEKAGVSPDVRIEVLESEKVPVRRRGAPSPPEQP